MFRSFSVCCRNGLFQIFAENYFSVTVYALAGSLFCRKSFQLKFNFCCNFFCQLFRICCKNTLSHHIVFGLSQKICCNPFWICRTVCNNKHFCRTCNHVNSHSTVNKFFCLSHKFIARPHNYINFRNRFRSKRHSTNSLTSSAGKNFVNTA